MRSERGISCSSHRKIVRLCVTPHIHGYQHSCKIELWAQRRSKYNQADGALQARETWRLQSLTRTREHGACRRLHARCNGGERKRSATENASRRSHQRAKTNRRVHLYMVDDSFETRRPATLAHCGVLVALITCRSGGAACAAR